MSESIIDEAFPIFFAHIINRQNNIRENNRRMVHYTRAETFLSLIRNREIWLRNTKCMNDFEEVEFGIRKIIEYFGGDMASNFWELLETTHPGSGGEIKSRFDGWLHDLKAETYITCVSEHLSEEDKLGRLSMWRAYGGGAGVALIINPGVMLRESDSLAAYSYPVFYFNEIEACGAFKAFTDRLIAEKEIIGKLKLEELVHYVFEVLQSYAFCLKHPGFKEEREWRVVFRPNYENSQYIKGSVVSINGIPQKIYKLPLENIPEEGLHGMSINELLEHVIIGPCDHPFVIKSALVEELSACGVEDAFNKISISDIPLR